MTLRSLISGFLLAHSLLIPSVASAQSELFRSGQFSTDAYDINFSCLSGFRGSLTNTGITVSSSGLFCGVSGFDPLSGIYIPEPDPIENESPPACPPAPAGLQSMGDDWCLFVIYVPEPKPVETDVPPVCPPAPAELESMGEDWCLYAIYFPEPRPVETETPPACPPAPAPLRHMGDDWCLYVIYAPGPEPVGNDTPPACPPAPAGLQSMGDDWCLYVVEKDDDYTDDDLFWVTEVEDIPASQDSLEPGDPNARQQGTTDTEVLFGIAIRQMLEAGAAEKGAEQGIKKTVERFAPGPWKHILEVLSVPEARAPENEEDLEE